MAAIRYYKEKDLKRLIAKAGGRCSYRHNGEICKRLLVHNNSVIGEIAHIIAVSEKGPRYDKSYDFSKANTYENLIWMCPTHHTIIDKMDDVGEYPVSVLLKMKEDHEKDMHNKNFSTGITLYDTVIHDYSSLSALFEYVDINKLYSSILDLPWKFDYDFTNFMDMVEAYEEGNGKFYLKDRYLNKLFSNMLCASKQLYEKIVKYFDIDPIIEPEMDDVKQYRCKPYPQVGVKEIEWVMYHTCWYQEAVDSFISAMEKRYPEIFYQKTYKLE